MRCYSAIEAGAVSFVMPVVQAFVSAAVNALMKRVASRAIKIFASLMVSGVLVLYGFLINKHIALVCLAVGLYSVPFSSFMLSNNNFMMSSAERDVKGMLSGCMNAFLETGFSLGVALINTFDDAYLSKNWAG